MANVTVEAKYVADTSQYVRALRAATAATNALADAVPKGIGAQKKASSATREMGNSAKEASKGFTILKNAMGTALGVQLYKSFSKFTSGIKGFTKASFDAAARSEELDIAMLAVGRSTGIGTKVIKETTQAIRDNGIELGAAQQIAIEFAQNNLDMASASKVARVAQDLAVIAGKNSTATTQTLTQAIITGNSMLLKSAGISSTASEGHAVYAKSIGKTAGTLSTVEKQQSIVNLIMKEGKKVAGTYEGAMNAAGKVLRSFSRIINDLQIEIGKVLLSAFGPLIKSTYELLKAFSKSLQSGGALSGTLTTLSAKFVELAAPLVAFIDRLTESVKSGEALKKVSDVVNKMIPIFMGLADAVKNILSFVIPLIPKIAALGATFLVTSEIMRLYKTFPGILSKIKTGILIVKYNAAAMNIVLAANPYIAVAAAIIIALAAVAAGFKYVYDRSEALREAVSDLMEVVKNIANVIMKDLLGAFSNSSDKADKLGSTSQSLSQTIEKMAKLYGDRLVPVLEVLGKVFKVVGNYIRVYIKYQEILFKVIYMVVNLIKLGLIATFNTLKKVITDVLGKLGPLGKMISDVFGSIGSVVKDAMSNAVKFVENGINGVIGLLNKMIDVYNKIPFVDQVGNISEIRFSNVDGIGTGSGAAREPTDYNKMGAEGPKGVNYTKKEEDTTGDGGGGGGGGSGKENKKLLAIKKKYENLKKALASASAAYKNIASQTESRFGEPSQIIKAFGVEGSISSTISQYDQLDASVRDYYKSLLKIPGLSKKVIKGIEKNRDDSRAQLKALAQNSVDLFNQLKENAVKLATLNDNYAQQQKGINDTYDELDKAAAASLKSVTEKWEKIIPALEGALSSATAAFTKENDALKELVSERDSFLGNIKSGINSFVNAFSFDAAGGSTITKQLNDRLKSVRQFSANIKELIARNLNPDLVRQFVEAGVSSAGDAVAALVSGSATQIADMNEIQTSLSAEIADFQEYASQQWFDAGIAQQEAIVGPLAMARDQAAAALATATASRATEIAAAQLHVDNLKIMRENALVAAKADYEREKAVIEANNTEIRAKLEENAKAVQDKYLTLQQTLPPEMDKLGMMSVQSILDGFKGKFPEMKRILNRKMDQLRDSMNRTAVINVVTRYSTEGKANAGGYSVQPRALGGPINAMQPYLVGERGPELFMSGSAGTIVPNNKLGSFMSSGSHGGGGNGGSSGGRSTININVNAGIGTDGAQVGREIVEQIKRFERTNGAVFVSA